MKKSKLLALIILLIFSLLFTYGGCSGGGSGEDIDTSADILLDVPFVQNYGGYSCASSSFTMVLLYYGIDVTFDDVWDVVGFPPDYGAFDEWIRNNFDLRREFLSDQTVDDIIYYIDEGFPPIVVQQYTYAQTTGHNRVVIGYNLDRNEFITNDPSDLGRRYRIQFDDFITLWDNFTNFIEPWWDPRPTFLLIPIDDPVP